MDAELSSIQWTSKLQLIQDLYGKYCPKGEPPQPPQRIQSQLELATDKPPQEERGLMDLPWSFAPLTSAQHKEDTYRHELSKGKKRLHLDTLSTTSSDAVRSGATRSWDNTMPWRLTPSFWTKRPVSDARLQNLSSPRSNSVPKNGALGRH